MSAETSAREKRTELVWLAALLLVVIVLRVFALGADPLRDTSGGFIDDWGDWVKNARQHLLWGRWVIDDANLGLYTAFAHTVAVRTSFALFGEGLAQANLVSAVSGIGLVLAVYLLVRAHSSSRIALIAASLIGINRLLIPHDRSSYPESLQLFFMVLALGTALSGPRWTAVLGGLAAALTIASKVTGFIVVPLAGAIWITLWAGRRFLGLPGSFSRRRLLLYGSGAIIVLLPFAAFFVFPHWSDIALEVSGSSGGFFAPVGRGGQPDRISVFGLSAFGLRLNGFFLLQWYLIAVALVFAVGRITRTLRQPPTQLELACWAWLAVGLLYLSQLFYQPDRRFLLLIPPLAILNALLLGQSVEFAASAWNPRWRRLAYAAATGLAAGMLAFYITHVFGPYRAITIAARFGRSLNYASAAGLLVSLAVVVSTILGWILLWRFKGTIRLRRSWIVLVIVFALTLWRWLADMSRRGYTLNRISQVLTTLTKSWPVEQRLIGGRAAPTFAIGTPLIGVGYELRQPGSLERFRPPLAIAVEWPALPIQPVLDGMREGPPARLECARFPVWLDRDNSPHFTAYLYIEPEHFAECRAAVASEGRLP